jgi:hypothetical protein
MSDSLSELTTKVQAALGDASGTYFTSAIVTAAVRAALSEINARAPIHSADLVDVVANTLVYEVSAIDPHALSVLSVHEYVTDSDDDLPRKFISFQEDARLWIRLASALSSGQLIIRYTTPYTVQSLDSETISTLPSMYTQMIVHGAAYHSCVIRAVARIETINLNQDVPASLLELKANFRSLFDAALNLAARQHAPDGKALSHGWEDDWHGWDL